MKHRKRDMINEAEAASTPAAPPVPEAQGDGEPAPVDVAQRDDTLAQAVVTDGGAPPAAPDDQAGRELAEQKEKFLRLAAEYDNYRRRTTKERLEAATRGQAELVMRLLESLDDLQRFADVDPATTDAQTLHKGIELVEQKVMKVLASVGLEVINPVDQSFDPNVHEAVTTDPAVAAEDDNTVSRVFQLGYRFGGQLLRPARVVVKQWNG